MENVEHGRLPTDISERAKNSFGKSIKADAEQQVRRLEQALRDKLVQKNELKTHIDDLKTHLLQLQPQLDRIKAIDVEMVGLGKHPLFPLHDNPYIHHAMQFLWDSDFVKFMIKAVEIQTKLSEGRAQIAQQIAELRSPNGSSGVDDKKTSADLTNEENRLKAGSNEEMRGLMASIFPKLEAYILYLYGRIDYPEAVRNSRVL
ncbi:hypothetical protein HY214_03435 [Candidatus Roizmanbacteria bacterium]|nr:hypothetical protein [Candidatus Roizmanbacteria bacterium]